MESLKGKKVKVVYKDNEKEKVVRGVLTSYDAHTITIVASITEKTVVVGKSALVSIMEVDK